MKLFHFHDWKFLESFIVEGRQVERQECEKCHRTRVTTTHTTNNTAYGGAKNITAAHTTRNTYGGGKNK